VTGGSGDDALRAENEALRAELAAAHAAAEAERSVQRAQQDALREAKENAEAANRAKDAFLARMSHELRSPLHVILGAVELLGPDVAGRDGSTVASIDSAARSLLALIEDLLDLSKIRAGSFSLVKRPFHLIQLFEDTISTMRTLSDAAGVELALTRRGVFPAYALGDAGRIRQIVTNLLSNAIKFARGGRVELRLTGWADALHIEVTDEGPGLAPDEERTIFEDFQQGALGKRRGGAGLGLAISRQLVTQMGGEMGYRPNPAGRGAAFWFEIPIEEATEADWLAASRRSSMPAMPSAARTSSLAPLLVVEDTPASRVWATRTLEARGFRVVAVESGEAALAELARGTFSAVLMDWHMAGMDGLATTRAIRALEGEMRLVPIVGLTASAQPGDREACIAAGMNECLFKPVSSRALVRAIEQLVKVATPAAPSPLSMPAAVIIPPTSSSPSLAGDVTTLPKDVQRELSELFDHDGAGLVRAVEAAAARDDRAAAMRSLHALKGLAGNLGMKALRTLAQDLEAALKAGEPTATLVPKLPLLERLRAEASRAFVLASGR
jgi:signal transduction histidine kinase/CheY-like chemotaxis protein/HPt (histidine-containing phosphotransfer) domain-containing protein